MILSMTFFVAGGEVKEDDNMLLMLQGLSLDHASAFADWLAIATNSEVHLRFMQAPGIVHDIRRAPADIQWNVSKAIDF